MTGAGRSKRVVESVDRRRGSRWLGWLAGLVVIVVVLTTGVPPAPIGPPPAAAARLDPVRCGQVYAVGQQQHTRQVYAVDHDSGAMTVNNTVDLPPSHAVNGLAVDADRGYFWMVAQRPGQRATTVVRVEAATGSQTEYRQPLPGAPAGNDGLVMGAFDPESGIYYFGMVSASNVLHLWGFDTATTTPIPGAVGRVPLGTGRGGDFAFDSHGRLHIVSEGVVLVLDEAVPTTGSTAPGPELAGTELAEPPGGAVGSMAFGPDGYLYVAGRTLHRLDPSTGDVVRSARLTPSIDSVADMGSCAPSNRISLVKDLPDGRDRPGDQFRLAISGGGSAEDAEGVTRGKAAGVQDRTPGAVAGPVAARPGSTYTITETAAGTADLDRYRSSWSCRDRVSGTVVGSGTGPTGRFDLPDGADEGTDVRCVFTNRPRPAEPPSKAEVSKAVDPVSGSVVNAGQSVGYRLTFSNSGETPAPVDVDEVIGDVLDDATLTSAPTSSDPKLEVTDLTDGRFNVAGVLAPGKTATVSYTVKINSDGSRGDDVLRGHLVDPGADAPAGCELDDLTCTENPVPALAATRTVGDEAEDDTRLEAGQEVATRLTFTNTGAAPAAVEVDDVIAGILDDAVLATTPTSSDPGLTVSDQRNGRLAVSGTVDPGRTVTVDYLIRVASQSRRGDGRLTGFLVGAGTEPPDECAPGTATCTSHRVGGTG